MLFPTPGGSCQAEAALDPCPRAAPLPRRYGSSRCPLNVAIEDQEHRYKTRREVTRSNLPRTPYLHSIMTADTGSALLSHLFRACRHAQASCPSAASGLPRGLRSSWKRQRSTGGREVGVDSTYATVRWLFHRAAAPYLALLAKWLYQVRRSVLFRACM